MRETIHSPLIKNNTLDFSKPCFDLKLRKPNKTFDIGKDGVSLLLDAQGRVRCFHITRGQRTNCQRRCYKASTYHPAYSMMVFCPFSQFDKSRFYDFPYVRAYRTRMLQWTQEERPDFGLDFHICADLVSIKTIKVNVALYSINLVNDVGPVHCIQSR
jgi:hypothetical protein